jgi:hypothetical protein
VTYGLPPYAKLLRDLISCRQRHRWTTFYQPVSRSFSRPSSPGHACRRRARSRLR